VITEGANGSSAFSSRGINKHPLNSASAARKTNKIFFFIIFLNMVNNIPYYIKKINKILYKKQGHI
jgi:hypothetical protein